MILREWRGKVETAQAEAYLDDLKSTGLADYAATQGHRGTLVLRHGEGALTEFTLLTLWESEQAIAAFAGDDASAGRFYPVLDAYLREHWPRARHYRVIVADFPKPEHFR